MTLCFANPHAGEQPTSENYFANGIGLYQKGEFAAAKEAFQHASLLSPKNAEIFYNWALTEIKLKNWGWATALLRKALYISPGLKEAEMALNFVKEKLTNPITSPSLNGLDYFKRKILFKIPWHLLFLLSLCFFVFSSLSLLKYFGKRKIAYLEESPLPQLPKWGALALFIFILFLFCIGLKSLELFEQRATLVVQSSQIHSGPSAEDTLLFEVYAGQELFISNKYQDWYQVKVPDGVTGWLPKTDLFFTTENQL